jgi:hypothetical protein
MQGLPTRLQDRARPTTADRRQLERERRRRALGDSPAARGLTFEELARRAEGDSEREALQLVLRDEVASGRVRLEGECYVLVPEAFDPGVLEAVAELERFV